MSNLTRILHPNRVVKTAEDNPIQFYQMMMPNFFRHTAEADWILSEIPLSSFNPVLRTNFPQCTADRAIGRMIEKFDSLSVPMSWWIGPSSRPLDLRDRLLAQGFALGESHPSMVLQLEHELPNRPAKGPEAFYVDCVSNRRELKGWFAIWASVFEIPMKSRPALLRLFIEAATRSHDVENYIGYLHQKPVATATLFAGRESAGIYNLATLNSVRGRGIGTYMALLAVGEAQRRGYRTVVLQASTSANGIYARIGFRYCYTHLTYYRSNTRRKRKNQ